MASPLLTPVGPAPLKVTQHPSSNNSTGGGAASNMDVRIDPRFLVFFRSRNPGDNQWSSSKTAIVNPTTFKESIQAHYSQRQVIGLSHEVAQYVRTGSRKLSMEIWLSYHLFMRRGLMDQNPDGLLEWRNWFESLLVPAGLGLAPQQIEINWPNAGLWFIGVLESMSIDYERFAGNGAPIELKLDLSFIETPSGLMTAGKVRAAGLGYAAYGPNAGVFSREK